jgi:uncharacterized protein YjbI with pentapeptide repeats
MSDTGKIGNKIAEARKRVHISQTRLAELLFISPQAVGKWERGESMPDIITFNRLAEILGVDLNYFSENFKSQSVGSGDGEAFTSLPKELYTEKSGQKLNWDMSRGNWVDADFSGLKKLHNKFNSSNMLRCRFNGSDLSGLLLKGNNIKSCDFSGCDISRSRIEGSNLSGNMFNESSLCEAEFSGCNINGCDFTAVRLNGTEFSKSYILGCGFKYADFTGVVIKSCGFTGAVVKSGDPERNILTNAVWKGTSFIDTHIADIIFTGIVDDCYFESCTFTRVTFLNASLTNTFFKNKSLKKIRFINCKTDRLTFEFLKSGKADFKGINLA